MLSFVSLIRGPFQILLSSFGLLVGRLPREEYGDTTIDRAERTQLYLYFELEVSDLHFSQETLVICTNTLPIMH